ncbi:chaperone required for assembly of F1-ATPase [Gluconobacter cerinus]|uniref:ATP12 family chaperone protein n=1 Tax=Gluconobacter cerinus TaxID=38307 RepID=UPI00222635AD|nr:ATP12 family chaperone protein [Gluconobacter cerinus]MCW2264779.1 chaperone required for assembly of F1-ATPase [Gluconobacter cerinus]
MSSRKRFWQSVSVGERDGLFSPELDGRPIRLPQGTVLAVASQSLAQAIVAEWEAIPKGASFTPEQLSMTRIAGTMIERIRPGLIEAREALLRLGLDDGLCYRKGPADSTVERVFAWLATQGIRPEVTDGLMPVTQSGDYVTGLERLLSRQGETELAALGVLTQCFGSLLLSLALLYGAISLEEAVFVANADERQQLLVWGQDDELIRIMAIRQKDAAETVQFLKLARNT